MTVRQEWWTSGELAELGLPDVPTESKNVRLMAERGEWRRAEWEGTRWRKRQGRGGGTEYHVSVLPRTAQIKLAFSAGAAAPEERGAERTGMWRWFEALPAHKQDEARRRLDAIAAVETLVRAGVKKIFAAQEVARAAGIALSGLYRWEALVHGVERADRLPYLAPRHAGRPGQAKCSPEAWEAFKADYLRPEKPNLTDCYARLQRAATVQGWTVPCRTTLARRIDALPPELVVLARDGIEALKRLYPAQQRDRGVFHALEAVNLDGHEWDVFVRWPDGTIGRPVMLAVQDLYSGMMLAWRIDQTLHKGLVRLAFGDVVETFGIPDHCYMDNGRENASKWITGGVPNRYRFKVRDEEPAGLLPQLGVEVHWTTPYSGQSKPIERGFRDFAQAIAKHPAFAGAYTGNTPMAKPENYRTSAVPLETFLRVVGEEIAQHNARPGRRSKVCGGRLSFAQAFEASRASAPVRLATPEQRRLWLLAAEALRVNRRDGTIEIEGNRYWMDGLLAFRGQTVVARFDPQALHEPLHVYRPDGGYLGVAQCTAAAGFGDVDAARAHGRARRAWMRASREMLDAERSMDIADVAALAAKVEPIAPMAAPETKVVRPLFGLAGANALQARVEDEDEISEGDRRLLEFARMRRADLHVVEGGDD